MQPSCSAPSWPPEVQGDQGQPGKANFKLPIPPPQIPTHTLGSTGLSWPVSSGYPQLLILAPELSEAALQVKGRNRHTSVSLLSPICTPVYPEASATLWFRMGRWIRGANLFQVAVFPEFLSSALSFQWICWDWITPYPSLPLGRLLSWLAPGTLTSPHALKPPPLFHLLESD